MRLCPLPVWSALCEQDDSCTFFQTPAWLRLSAKYLDAEPAPLLFEWSGGVAALPLLHRRRGLWDSYFSPFGTYAALIGPDRIPIPERQAMAEKIASFNVTLASSPFTRNPLHFRQPIPSETSVLDLRHLKHATVESRWNQNQRRCLRRALRQGFELRQASQPHHIPEYDRLYRSALSRWGERARTRHPLSLFQDIFRQVPPSSCRFWRVEKGGRLVAGCLVFYHNLHACLWHTAADDALFSEGVTQFLYHGVIQDAQRRGCAWFDFGPSPGLKSLGEFKLKFGARRAHFTGSRHRKTSYALAQGAKQLLLSIL